MTKIDMKKLLILGLVLSSLLSARDVVDESGMCSINWTQGHITCEGESEVGQSKYAATLVSKVIAQRNLLEVIKGVRIDSITTVKDGLLSSYIIQSRVQGVIKGAQIVFNKYNKQEGYATAKARIYMGKDLLAALLSDPTQFSWNEKIEQFFANFSLISSAQASTYNLADKDTLNKILEDFKAQGDTDSINFIETALSSLNDKSYSGILIDVSNLDNFQKAMIVRLVDENGKEVYPAKRISKRSLTKHNTSVGYIFGFEDARANKRVFNVPLELKVTKVYKNKKSNIVLNTQQIAQINALNEDIFQKAKIILVLGD